MPIKMGLLYLQGEQCFDEYGAFQQREGSTVIEYVAAEKYKHADNDFYAKVGTIGCQGSIRFYDRKSEVVSVIERVFCVGWQRILKANSEILAFYHSLLTRCKKIAPLVNMLVRHEPFGGVTSLRSSAEYDTSLDARRIAASYPLKINDDIKENFIQNKVCAQ